MKRLLGITGLVSLLFVVPIATQVRRNSIEDQINQVQKKVESKSEYKAETQDKDGIFELIGYISDSTGENYTKKTLVKFKGKPEKGELKDFDGDEDPDFIFNGFIIENDKKIHGTFVSENDGKGNYSKPRIIKSY